MNNFSKSNIRVWQALVEHQDHGTIKTFREQIFMMTYRLPLFLHQLLIAGILAGTNAFAECVDTPPAGDGWGWNGIESCRTGTQPAKSACIDTPPANDGWGWNGVTSCTIAASEAECVDTPPLADGWGWNGSTSCRVDSSQETTEPLSCIDTDPVGDGWGWNGVASCRIHSRPTQTIMPVGDSITHGAKGQKSYRHNFLSRLRDSNCNHTMVGSQNQNEVDTGFLSEHESYSTMKADHFLTGHTTWSGHNEGIQASISRYLPDVVLLHIGSNDLYYHESIASTANEIREIITIIRNTKPSAKILVSNVIPWFGSSDRNEDIVSDSLDLGIAISQVVTEVNSDSAIFVDVYSGYTRDMMLADLVHPNSIGEQHIASRFFSSYLQAGLCESPDPQ